MRILLFVLSLLSFLAGMLTLIVSKSAIHEIQAYVLFLIWAVLFTGAAIVEAVNRLRAAVERPPQT